MKAITRIECISAIADQDDSVFIEVRLAADGTYTLRVMIDAAMVLIVRNIDHNLLSWVLPHKEDR